MKQAFLICCVGGRFDGTQFPTVCEPDWLREILYVYECAPDCDGHASFNSDRVPAAGALAYRRENVDEDAGVATYVVGELVDLPRSVVWEDAYTGTLSPA